MIGKNNIILSRYIAGRLNCLIRIYEDGVLPPTVFSPVYGLSDPVIEQGDLLAHLLRRDADNSPHLIGVSDAVVYASVFTEDLAYVIGPLRTEYPVALREQATGCQIAEEWLSGVFPCSYSSLINTVIFLHNMGHDFLLDRSDADRLFTDSTALPTDVKKRALEVSFECRETQVMHNPYSEEERLMGFIERGDTAGLEQFWKEDTNSGKNQQNYGHLSKNQGRNAKDLAISVITLASRAAIRGGLRAETAFTLVDSYIQQVEESAKRNEIPLIVHSAEIHFTELVASTQLLHGHSPKVGPYMKECKDYIQRHLHSRISIPDIAAALHVSPNYLSGIFREETGMTIGAYIRAEKIRLVKDLLLYSPYSYIEIANLLAFSSQSYLGTVFKAETGMTMREYRIQGSQL